MQTKISPSLSQNIAYLLETLPIETSYDIITRNFKLGSTNAYWIGINGFCKTEILQKVFSDLQNPLYMENPQIQDIVLYLQSKIGYVQTSLLSNWEDVLFHLLSGPSILFIDGFSQAILLDVRTYPTRSISEPDTERVTKGSRDGFVETLLFNTNLIRRHIRMPQLTFEIMHVGAASQTDISIAYIKNLADDTLLENIKHAISKLHVTSLTMGSKSLEELLIPKSWLHPLPSIQSTERPDVACSYLMEGHILLIVDNSPSVLILPCNIFQFTQNPEDYYKSPLVGSYSRCVRFCCILISLLLMPVFLLLGAYYPTITEKWNLLSSKPVTPAALIFFVLVVEFILDLFKYSASVNTSKFSGPLSIIGGLLIGEIAVSLNWASLEVFFYAAITLLTSLAVSNIDFVDGLRIYRIFLLIMTAIGGVKGFILGVLLTLISIATTPTFDSTNYLWPLIPFQWKPLKSLLVRSHTAKAQPIKSWKQPMALKFHLKKKN